MDLLSRLPDEVLSHILSFLPTKEAASTSVLSKKWRYLFAFVPNLAFDDSVFLHPEEGKRERDEIMQSFKDFVDRVLALQGNSPIKKLSLKCKSEIDEDGEEHVDHLDRWICNVLQRGVLDLDLSIDDEDGYYKLPREIFVSSTLVNLTLSNDLRTVPLLPGAEDTFLPRLKTLVIDNGWIWEELEVLIPAFPVLEKLDIDNFEWKDSVHTVSSVSLRKLIIYADGFDDFSNPKSISFDTPSLVYLDYSDYVAEDYPKVNLTNLAEAILNFKLTEEQIELIRAPNDADDVFLRLRNVWKLFSGIRNAQKLFFSPNTLEVLSLCCESMPVFNNLRLLRIMSLEDRGWQAMPDLLRNCPHLETLVLTGLLHYVTDKCGDACDCIPREYKGYSLRSCPVKSIEIHKFRGTVREIGMIRHFLYSFPCLEEMRINDVEKSLTDFKVPEMSQVVVEMIYDLYNEFARRGVKFLVSSSWCLHLLVSTLL